MKENSVYNSIALINKRHVISFYSKFSYAYETPDLNHAMKGILRALGKVQSNKTRPRQRCRHAYRNEPIVSGKS